MGPLVPYGIINSEFDYIIALILGIVFGFILEQAGFSSSRKLAGVFYGYDFVVLRVFFTAAITAMVGILFFNYFGWINRDILFVNPTYLWPIIVGGVIMGFGFIIGGYCPGTSVCGAAIGKIDAMAFIGGTFIGILIFAEVFPLFKNFYTSGFLGNIFVYDSIGISQGFFAFMLIVVALIVFIATAWIEKKSKNIKLLNQTTSKTKTELAVTLLLILGVVLIFIPEKRNISYKIPASEILIELKSPDRVISADELAFKIIHNDHSIQLIDVRPAEKFIKFSLPDAVNIPFENIHDNDWKDFLNQEEKQIIFFSNGKVLADQAWMLCRRKGYKNIYVLSGGLNNWVETILKPQAVVQSTDKSEIDKYRFRERARKYFLESGDEKQVKKSKKKTPKKKIMNRVEGGC